MDATCRAILEHHEHFDGSGYPYGLRGDDLSVPACILSVAETYDSTVSARPHRGAVPPEEALRMVKDGASTLFDPEVAQLFATTAPSHRPARRMHRPPVVAFASLTTRNHGDVCL